MTEPNSDRGDSLCDEQIVDGLVALGVSGAAARAYGALLLLPATDPDGLSAHLGLDAAAVAPLLTELAEHGMVSQHEGRIRVVRPAVALPPLLDEADQRLHATQAGLAAARVASNALVAAARVDDQERSILELVNGATAAGDRVSDLLAEATSEVRTMVTTLPGEQTLAHARASDTWLLDRGVRVRMLVLAGHLPRSRAYQEHLRLLAGRGAQIRVAATLPTRMILIDGFAAVLPDDESEPQHGAVVVRHRSLVRLAMDVFESVWDSARELAPIAEVAGTDWQPSDLEREVIALLSQGNKDEAVARRVGMSVRSLRRLIAGISQQTGTESRFELGVRCHQRGWV